MNKMKAREKGKASYTEKLNTHVPSGWCVHRTFAYGDIPNALKICRGKDCEKVCGIHRGRGKANVCNISTAAHDRGYQCVGERKQSRSKVSHLPQRVQ